MKLFKNFLQVLVLISEF